MNLAALAPDWLFWMLLACLAAAAIQDIAQLRIWNLTCAAIVLLAIATVVLAGPDWSVWQNLLVFGAIVALGTAAFGSGYVGGGDVKLLAAVGLWTPLKVAVPLLLSIFLAGGALALAAMLFWAFRKSSRSSVKTRQIPYGLAIAFGAALVLQGVRS